MAAVAAAVALAIQNRSLRAELARVETDFAAAREASGTARSPELPSADAGRPAPQDAVAPQDVPGRVDREAFEKAVEERAVARAKEMEDQQRNEREAHRREWENATEEEREEHRKQFRERMQAHSAAQISEFETKVGLDVEQCAAFEMELETFDNRVREIAERFAVMIDGGVAPGFELQARLLNEMSAAAIDAYDGIDDALPEGWREKGGDFNMIFGMSPVSMAPLFDAMRRAGVFGPHGPGPFGPFDGRRGRSRQ